MDLLTKDLSTKQVTLSSCISRFSYIIENIIITTRLQNAVSINSGMTEVIQLLDHCRQITGTVYITGNGGSAAIASHAVIDFINMDKMRATAMQDTAVTTCISNDYGYEHVYSKQLAHFIESEDVLIAISSSGKSQNIMNAVSVAKNRNAAVITLTGFLFDNPLRKMGDYNLWLDSTDYGQVEIGHAFILHYLTDRLRDMIKEKE